MKRGNNFPNFQKDISNSEIPKEKTIRNQCTYLFFSFESDLFLDDFHHT